MTSLNFSKGVYWLKLRVKKEDSAFLYALFEAQEGIVSYSTLDTVPGALHRDLEVQIPPGNLDEVQSLVDEIREWAWVM
jgi:hypothetical protein